MFCPNCGNEFSDGAVFCDKCGHQVGSTEETAFFEDNSGATEVLEENNNNSEPAAVAVEEPTLVGDNFAQPSFEKPKKKKKTGLIIGLSAGVVVLAAVALVVCGLTIFRGSLIKAFGSDEAYFKYVENKAFADGADSLSKAYGKMNENVGKSTTTDANIAFEISDEVIELIEKEVGEEFDWAKNINADINTVVDDGKEEVELKLNFGEDTVLDFAAILDMEESDMYLAFADLSDKYLLIDNELDASASSASAYAADPEFIEAMPTEKEMNKLLKKYIKIAIDNLDNVDKSTEEIEIEGIEQKVTALEFKLTEENAMEIAEEVLKELKKDKDVKEYIKNVQEYLEDEEDYDGDLYDEFKDAVDEALDEIEEGEYDDDKVIFVLTDYVNGRHEIIGRKFEVDSEEIFYYATVRDGKEFAFEAKAAEYEIEGEGNDKWDKLNAEYKLKFEDITLAEMEITDLDCDKWEDGIVDGNIKITPAKFLLSIMMGESQLSDISLVDPALELDFEGKKDSSKVEINVLSGDKLYFGMTLSGSVKDGGKVKLPDSSDVTTSEEEWEVDIDKLAEILVNAGVPENWLYGRQDTGISNGYDYDDYYNDYYGFNGNSSGYGDTWDDYGDFFEDYDDALGGYAY